MRKTIPKKRQRPSRARYWPFARTKTARAIQAEIEGLTIQSRCPWWCCEREQPPWLIACPMCGEIRSDALSERVTFTAPILSNWTHDAESDITTALCLGSARVGGRVGVAQFTIRLPGQRSELHDIVAGLLTRRIALDDAMRHAAAERGAK